MYTVQSEDIQVPLSLLEPTGFHFFSDGLTSVLQYLLYDKSFNLFEFGQGAAIGMITALLVLTTTFVLNRVFHTEGGREQ